MELSNAQDDISWNLGGDFTLQGLKLGDWIKVTCRENTLDSSLNVQRTFEGEIVSMFNAFKKDGSDNWQIEIKSPQSWFLWKPVIDGGHFEHIIPKTQKRRF